VGKCSKDLGAVPGTCRQSLWCCD